MFNISNLFSSYPFSKDMPFMSVLPTGLGDLGGFV